MKTENLIQIDQKARQDALNPTQSFIVQAPAGSGKTELLIQRFLTLLTTVKKPEEILAITFTKKAANEMRARVLKSLKMTLSNEEPTSSHAQLTLQLARQVIQRDAVNNWNLLQNPNQLRIQTIDSLCSYLTAQLPLLSHIGGQVNLTENASELYSKAVQEVLAHVEENDEWADAIAVLLLHLDNDLNKLHDLLIRLLQKRDQWLPYLHLQHTNDALKSILETYLELIICDHFRQLKNLFSDALLQSLLPILRYSAMHVEADSFLYALRDINKIPDNTSEAVIIWKGIATLFLTKSFSWRKRVDESIGFPAKTKLKNANEIETREIIKQTLLNIIINLNHREDLRSALEEIFFLPLPQFDSLQWDVLQSLLTVLKLCAAQLRVTFQQHGQIDFIENAQAALSALGNDDEATDLALALDYQIKHILIDEFQDTSTTQYQLLQKLTAGWDGQDGRTLFVVGDPMQSIYRFREAEVGLFLRMYTQGLRHLALTPLRLTVNFRSDNAIVDWNNTTFATVLPEYNDLATGAVRFSASIARDANFSEHAFVKINGFSDTHESQTAWILQTVKQLLIDFPKEKIAILVRSRSHLSNLIAAFKKAKIVYHAVDIETLSKQQCIQDLYSLTRALLHPADRIAWLAILRAPWCGLTLADLLILGKDRGRQTIWEQLNNPIIFKQFSHDAQLRLNRVLPILKSQLAERERHTLKNWVENTWTLLGGPATLSQISELEDVENYFTLLNKLENHDHLLTQHYLARELTALYATHHHENAGLEIMTIHSAKGLEFDTVILPHLEKKLPVDDKSLLTFLEQPLSDSQNALLLAPLHAADKDHDVLYSFITRKQKFKAAHETNRLLYVAATRAKKRLYLSFETDFSKKISPETGSFLKVLWPILEKKSDQILEKNNILVSTIDDTNKQQHTLQRVTTDWKNPISESENKLLFHQAAMGFQLPNQNPKIIGIVAHRLLQFISNHGVNWWEQKTLMTKIHFIKSELHLSGMIPSQMERASETIMHVVTKTLQDARGLWILSAQAEAQTEFALTALLDQQLHYLVIDKTFVDENIRWIIDYKTTTFSDADLEYFLQHEQEKYLEKMQLYAKALRLTDEREIHLGLYFPYLSAWKEWKAQF